MQHPYYTPPNTAEQLTGWSANNTGSFLDNSANVNPYNMMSSPRQPQFPQQGAPAPSTALTRRGLNNQLVPTTRPFNPQQNDPWGGFSEENLVANQNGTPVMDENDNIELLEEKAQKAKRDAQAKRKQIPPFVQKLNRLVIF
jgi:heat shock transcription factor